MKKPVAATAANAPRSGGTVTVACKVPNGLVLQLCRPNTQIVNVRGNRHEETVYSKIGQTFTVAGPAYPNGPVPRGFKAPPLIVGGYAMTRGIPADFWEEWLNQNAEASYVTSRMIYACDRADEARGLAEDHKDTLSGFEPLNPESDTRMPRGAPGVGAISPADEQVARNTQLQPAFDDND